MTISFENPEPLEGLPSSDGKIRTALIKIKEAIAELEGFGHPVKWYAPKIIPTEESRENTAFGTLTTKDEITGIAVPENGLIVVSASAQVKSSVAAAGRIALFIGSNQLTDPNNAVLEGATQETGFRRFIFTEGTGGGAWTRGTAATLTTGRPVGVVQIGELAAGTHTVSLQYKATSGTVSAKERKLFVYTVGI